MTISDGNSYQYEHAVREKRSAESTSTPQKSYGGAREFRWSPRVAEQENTLAGCSKKPPSKAAADEQAAGVPSGVR